MRAHNVCFDREIRRIIFELSSIPPLIRSSTYTVGVIIYVLQRNKQNTGRPELSLSPLTWMDGWFAILCPFQQYFSHIRMMGGWWWKTVSHGSPFRAEKILPGAGIKLTYLELWYMEVCYHSKSHFVICMKKLPILWNIWNASSWTFSWQWKALTSGRSVSWSN